MFGGSDIENAIAKAVFAKGISMFGGSDIGNAIAKALFAKGISMFERSIVGLAIVKAISASSVMAFEGWVRSFPSMRDRAFMSCWLMHRVAIGLLLVGDYWEL